ncbi:MAG TPA: tetratricopeptide repeat protein [Verrucomicrobiae bacterium]|jgi:TolA-binding protein
MFGKLARTVALMAALLMSGGAALAAPADDPREVRDFQFALNLFQDSHYQLAETNFTDFLSKYTNSPHRPDAILYIGRARLYQSNFNGSIDLLQKAIADAGALRPDYLFWTAKARSAAGDLTGAEQGFSIVAKEYALSPVRLESAYDQAEIRSRQGDWPGAVRLLQETNSPFQAAAAADGKSQFVPLGWLLLGEALLHEQRAGDGEAALLHLHPAALNPDLRWRSQYLSCRLQLAGGKAEAALAASANLSKLDADANCQAASIFLQGEILEKLGRPTEALAAYAKNLSDTQTPDAQRQALARVIELTVELNPPAKAIPALEAIIAPRLPQAPGQDLARLTMGELYLKAAASPPGSNAPAADTNLLAAALTNLNSVLTNYTNSPLLAKARLDRGWCEWLSTNILAARSDFEEAAAHLPPSPDQAVARFKLADTQFLLKDYAGAAANYALVLDKSPNMPAVTNSLFDLALYQLAESDIQRGDIAGARAAVDKILRWFPGSYFGDRGSLLIGGDLNRKDDYAQARKVFTEVFDRTPDSQLRSEAQYAVARTYEAEGDWASAIERYKTWASLHAANPLFPEVEFHLALSCGKAGRTNDELAIITNFADRFPSNALAPWALNRAADFSYNQQDWRAAEKYYQQLFNKYPDAGEVAYQARFWAGRAALARQGTEEATDYFLKLVNLTNAPQPLVARGYLALGDIFFQQFQASQTLSNLNQAIAALVPFTNGAPTNAIAVEALGRLGDYFMAYPGSNSYAIARQMYETIVNFPLGSIGAAERCQAEVGLGLLAEKEKNPKLALEHYCNVVDNKYGPGGFDPYWVERAGEYAARICEDGQHWTEAVKIYDRLLQEAPASRPVLEKKRAAAQARIVTVK